MPQLTCSWQVQNSTMYNCSSQLWQWQNKGIGGGVWHVITTTLTNDGSTQVWSVVKQRRLNASHCCMWLPPYTATAYGCQHDQCSDLSWTLVVLGRYLCSDLYSTSQHSMKPPSFSKLSGCHHNVVLGETAMGGQWRWCTSWWHVGFIASWS